MKKRNLQNVLVLAPGHITKHIALNLERFSVDKIRQGQAYRDDPYSNNCHQHVTFGHARTKRIQYGGVSETKEMKTLYLCCK